MVVSTLDLCGSPAPGQNAPSEEHRPGMVGTMLREAVGQKGSRRRHMRCRP